MQILPYVTYLYLYKPAHIIKMCPLCWISVFCSTTYGEIPQQYFEDIFGLKNHSVTWKCDGYLEAAIGIVDIDTFPLESNKNGQKIKEERPWANRSRGKEVRDSRGGPQNMIRL